MSLQLQDVRPPLAPAAAPRIAFITTSAMTQWMFLRGQLKLYQSRGFDVTAVCAADEYTDRLEAEAVRVIRVSFTRKRDALLADLRTLVEMIGALRRLRPHIVHASTPKAALVGLLSAALLRIPVRVFLMRGTMTPRYSGMKRRLVRAAEILTARLATHTVCVSPSLLRFAREEGIVSNGAGVVLGEGMSNGIDLSRFHRRCERVGEFRLGYVGRIARDKGIEELAAAWRQVSSRLPHARLSLVGPIDKADPISDSILKELRSDRRVSMPGLVEDPAAWYADMDVLVMLSRGSEGFPNAPMEAAAAAVPTIATCILGNVDAVIHNVTGMLVVPDDIDSVVQTIMRYASNPDLVAAHGAAARARVEAHFTQARVWEAHFQYVCRAATPQAVQAP